MRADRLLKLADYLETVPRGNFVMEHWVRDDAITPSGKAKECGFAGCAIGWAVHGKLFRGLKFIPKFSNGGGGLRPWPAYKGLEDFYAIRELFGISDTDAESLFGSWTKGTPKQVAKRIRKYVRFAGAAKAAGETP